MCGHRSSYSLRWIPGRYGVRTYGHWIPAKTLHLVPQFLKHPHELQVHLGGPASTSAGHLIDGEIGGDHVSHEHSSSKNKFTAQYKQAALEFPIRFQLRLHLKNPPVVKQIG